MFGGGRPGFSRPAACKQELRVRLGRVDWLLWNVAGEGGAGMGKGEEWVGNSF